MRLLTVTLVLTILLIACSRGEIQQATNQPTKSSRAQESIHAKDSADSKQTNTYAADLGSAHEIQFERQVTYGSTKDVIVGEIATFAVDEQNRVFLGDIDQTNVHAFSPDGSYLTSLGRQGKGPGEFAAVSSNTTMVVHSNRLYATDTEFYFPHRAHVYALEDLSFSHTMKLLAENRDDYEQLKGYSPKRIYPRRDGTFLVPYHRLPNEYKDAESYIRYVVQDSIGNIILGPILEQKDLTHLVYKVTNAPVPYLAVSPFPFYGKSLLIVSDNDHLYAANNTEEFKIDVYDTSGKRIRTFQHPFNNRPLTRSGLIDRYKRLGEGVAVNMIREAQNLPATWPALETMLIDDEGRLWVATIVEDFEVYEWWVLKPSGEVITTFEWSREKSIEVVRNGCMYTRETEEETGIEEIVRYRMELN